MKIIIYSTNANHFTGEMNTLHIPSCKSRWTDFIEKHKEIEIVIVAHKPARFLLDMEGLNALPLPVKTIIVEEEGAEKIAQYIIEEKCDVAIALSAWARPFDWLSLQDAEVAEILEAQGIKTIAMSSKTAFTCFDKWQTHLILESAGITTPKAVYVHHNLFFCAGNKKEIRNNVYKEAVLAQIKSMHYPVIIKDTVGLSSYGMEVVNTFLEAKRFLESKRNSSDRIVEEFISGIQFGAEIHGVEKYNVLPPFMFSVNKYGITSPKQSIKVGPVTNEKYKVRELKKILERIAEKLDFKLIAQIDAVFDGEKWYIIEINPRISGMSETYAASMGLSLYDMILLASGAKEVDKSEERVLKPTLNIKFPLLSLEDLTSLSEKPYIAHISQTENKAALQEREKGYCEVILCANTFAELHNNLSDLEKSFPALIEKDFIDKAKEMLLSQNLA